MDCPFQVGQRVICIDDDFHQRFPEDVGTIFPVKGQIYTVRSVELTRYGPAITLVEIINVDQLYEDGFGELNFLPRRFRPVVERKTDISIFTRMLTGAKTQVTA